MKDNHPPLQLKFLGTPQIIQNDALVTGFITRKVQALFIYLAVTGRPHSRETLAGLFWPNMPDSDAKTNLRKALSNMRQLLPDYVIINRQDVSVNPHSDIALDTISLVQAGSILENGKLAKGSIPKLTTAAEIYQGEFLEGFFLEGCLAFEEWMIGWRERLREMAIQGLRVLAEYHVQTRQHNQAITFLQRLLLLDPWREEAHRQLMMVYARSGQRSAALAQYQKCSHLLEQELGVSPLPETTLLHERILQLHTSQRLQRPAQPSPFIGRHKEIEKITQLTSDPNCRLLTIIGPGGIGKTCLALEAAGRQDTYFLDGISFVALTAVSDRPGLIQALAASLHLTFHDQGQPEEQLVNHLQHREYLLILDNFEHLLPHASFVDAILSRAPQVKVWITSRVRSTLPWEWLYEVRGLPYPADEAHPVESYDAIQLFIHSAQRLQPQFELTERDIPSLIRLCQMLEGLPLGLTLAAGWRDVLSCAEICQEIEQSLEFLASSHAHLPERHRSLHAVLQHSWDMLTPAEQHVYLQLAIFKGGFDGRAAQEVAGVAAMTIASFVNKSLLRRNNGRYDLHELWRQFLRDHLNNNPDLLAQVQKKHAHYYLLLLKEGSESEYLVENFENIWAGWRWIAKQGDHQTLEIYVDHLTAFLEKQHRYQEMVILFEEAFNEIRHQSNLKLAIPSFKQATWQRQLGEAYFRLGRLPESKAYHQLAVNTLNLAMPSSTVKLGMSFVGQFARQVNHRLRMGNHHSSPLANNDRLLEGANAYERLGQIFFFSNQALEGAYTALRGLNLAENAVPSPTLARLYANMCLGMALIPLHGPARYYLNQALYTARKLKHQPALAWTLELGSIYYSGVGQWGLVEEMAVEAAELSRSLGDMRRWEECVVMLAHKAHFLGKFKESIAFWNELYVSALQRGDIQSQRWALTGKAENLLPLGQFGESIDLLQMAMNTEVDLTDSGTDISGYGLLSLTYFHQGDVAAAEKAANHARKLISQSSPTSFATLEGYAATAETHIRLWKKTGRPEFQSSALELCHAFKGFARVFPIGKPRSWLLWGEYYKTAGRSRRARTARNKSLAAAQHLKMPYEEKLLQVFLG